MGREQEKRQMRMQTADRRLREHQGGGRPTTKVPPGTNFFNPKSDKTLCISIVPYEVTRKGNPYCDPGYWYYERTFWVHRNVGPAEDAYVCPAKTMNSPCPICEHRAKMMQDPRLTEEQQKFAKTLKPSDRQLWNVLDHDEPGKGVQLWDISNFLFGMYLDNKINRARPDDREALKSFYNPDKGYMLLVTPNVKATPMGKLTEFSGIEFRERKEPLSDSILEKAIDLDACIVIPPYNKLKALFYGEDDSAEENAQPETREEVIVKEEPKKQEETPRRRLIVDDDDEEEDKPKSSSKPAVEILNPPPSSDGDDLTASDLGLENKMKVFHKKHGECTIVKISGDGTSITLQDEEGEIHRAIAPSECKRGKPKQEAPKRTVEQESPPPKKKSSDLPLDFDNEEDDSDLEEVRGKGKSKSGD